MVLLASEMPIRAIREQIASAIDVVIQYTRFGDGARKVTEVSEIVGLDDESGEIIVEGIFTYQYPVGDATGSLRHTGYIPTFFYELVRKLGISLDLLFDPGEEGRV
jgi:pilus assembly protein CpaF